MFWTHHGLLYFRDSSTFWFKTKTILVSIFHFLNLFAISKNLQKGLVVLCVPFPVFSHSLLFCTVYWPCFPLYFFFFLNTLSGLILLYFLGALSCSLITLFPGNYFCLVVAGAQSTGMPAPLWQAGNDFSLLGGQFLHFFFSLLLHTPSIPHRLTHPGLRKVCFIFRVCLYGFRTADWAVRQAYSGTTYTKYAVSFHAIIC